MAAGGSGDGFYPGVDEELSPHPHSAVQLFIERARQGRPDLVLAADDPAIARICRLVEGLPLALELAANWTRTLACEAIADEIQRDVDFLATRASNVPERHRSTRAVFDHSWRLLSDQERSAFARLAIFRGSFTREAAAQVSGVALTSLAALVDKSLVRLGATGRYDIHELLRQYGAEQLAAMGLVEALQDSHAAFFAGLMARCEPDLKSDRLLSALDAIEADFDNVRAAWTHAVARRDVHRVDLMTTGLFLYAVWRSRLAEVQALFALAADALAPEPGGAPDPAWGRVLIRARIADMPAIEQALAIAALTIGQRRSHPFHYLRAGNERSNRVGTTQALLVIDMQQGLFERSTPIYRAEELLQIIRTLADQAHASGTPVFFIQHWNDSFLAQGSPGWQFHPDLQPTESDTVIGKRHPNAFERTPLRQELEAHGITTLVVTGLVSHGCVKATCLGALELGYGVILVADGHSNYHKKAAAVIMDCNQALRQAGIDVCPAREIAF